MHIYTDGAQSSKTLCGGWAMAVFDKDNKCIHSERGAEENTTNNRMELKAFLAAVEYAKFNTEQHIIYSDSAYIVNCFKDKWYENWQTNGWKTANKHQVANRDLWEEILSAYEAAKIKPLIQKVEGHSNCEQNNYVDKLAVKAREELIK